MIHFTKEGGRKKIGLNLYRTRGGFVVAWVWYYPATHELKCWRFRLRMHMKPRILWSVDSCNVISNYLTIHDLQLVNREVLVDLVASDNEGRMTKEEIIDMARQAGFIDYELDDGTTNAFDKRYEAFTKLVAEKAIKEALAQPEQEPVAYIQVSKTGNVMACAKTGDFYKLPDKTLLYTSPQPAPVQQEPVAWMVWAEDNVPSLTFKKPSDEYVFDSLYTAPPQLKPLTHEQRFDLLTKFEPYKNKWEAPSILIDMVEATHNIKENT